MTSRQRRSVIGSHSFCMARRLWRQLNWSLWLADCCPASFSWLSVIWLTLMIGDWPALWWGGQRNGGPLLVVCFASVLLNLLWLDDVTETEISDWLRVISVFIWSFSIGRFFNVTEMDFPHWSYFFCNLLCHIFCRITYSCVLVFLSLFAPTDMLVCHTFTLVIAAFFRSYCDTDHPFFFVAWMEVSDWQYNFVCIYLRFSY